jgi:hypothetical protein
LTLLLNTIIFNLIIEVSEKLNHGLQAGAGSRPNVHEYTTDGFIPGDVLRFKGHTTDFTQEVTSMEVDNKTVEEAGPGDLAGIKTNERVRENDKVYRVEQQ